MWDKSKHEWKESWRGMVPWLTVSIPPIQVKVSVSTWECNSIMWLAVPATRISVLYLMVRSDRVRISYEIKFKTQRTLTAIYATLIDTSWCDALSDTAQSVARRVTQYGTVTTQDLEGKCLTLLQTCCSKRSSSDGSCEWDNKAINVLIDTDTVERMEISYMAKEDRVIQMEVNKVKATGVTRYNVNPNLSSREMTAIYRY